MERDDFDQKECVRLKRELDRKQAVIDVLRKRLEMFANYEPREGAGIMEQSINDAYSIDARRVLARADKLEKE